LIALADTKLTDELNLMLISIKKGQDFWHEEQEGRQSPEVHSSRDQTGSKQDITATSCQCP